MENQDEARGAAGELKAELKAQVDAVRLATELSSGSLPSPELLASYEQVIPGLTERLLRIAEQSMEYRRQLELEAFAEAQVQRRLQFLGLVFAFTLASLSFGLALFLGSEGYEVASVGVVITTLTTVLVSALARLNR